MSRLAELLTTNPPDPDALSARARVEALLDEVSWAWDAGLSALLDQAVTTDERQ